MSGAYHFILSKDIYGVQVHLYLNGNERRLYHHVIYNIDISTSLASLPQYCQKQPSQSSGPEGALKTVTIVIDS